jgi:hypothetical protein
VACRAEASPRSVQIPPDLPRPASLSSGQGGTLWGGASLILRSPICGGLIAPCLPPACAHTVLSPPARRARPWPSNDLSPLRLRPRIANWLAPQEQGATGNLSHNRSFETPRGAVISQRSSAADFA